MTATEIPVHALLNAQTGRIEWPELARHFARGVVVCVAPGTDLVAVAERFVGNSAEEIERLSDAGRLWRAQDEDARRWQAEHTRFWAVVVAPWVLVQEAENPEDNSNED
ncbi:MAG: DUF2288 domain-containing protein [Xanthomonadales bacterium]